VAEDRGGNGQSESSGIPSPVKTVAELGRWSGCVSAAGACTTAPNCWRSSRCRRPLVLLIRQTGMDEEPRRPVLYLAVAPPLSAGNWTPMSSRRTQSQVTTDGESHRFLYVSPVSRTESRVSAGGRQPSSSLRISYFSTADSIEDQRRMHRGGARRRETDRGRIALSRK
jgi:hypothetical protein